MPASKSWPSRAHGKKGAGGTGAKRGISPPEKRTSNDKTRYPTKRNKHYPHFSGSVTVTGEKDMQRPGKIDSA